MDRPLLSFCVFTYNRALLLTQLLDQLAQIKAAFPPGVIEVVISDNASTDNTAALIRERYAARGFKLVVQERNIGVSRNWLESINQSTGTYVWPYADDDLVDIPAVTDMIANHLQHGTADLYHFNYAQGIYTDNPRLSAQMGQIARGIDSDRIFPDIASMIPYCGVILRGILLPINIFRGDEVRGKDFEDCFEITDMFENAAVLLKAFKHKKCALLHKCGMIHIHPPEPRWFNEARDGMPGRYLLTFPLMVRMTQLIRRGIIAPAMIEDDGFVYVEKQGEQYVTIRKKIAHVLFPDILDVVKKVGKPMPAKDCGTIAAFAAHFTDPKMKLIYQGLQELAATQDASLLEKLEKLRGQVDEAGRIVMWQSSSCPDYDRYMGQTLDLSALGAR